MNDEEYVVFKGKSHERPLRLGTVRRRERAIDLMYRMYARMPGDYFIRYSDTNEIVAVLQSASRAGVTSRGPDFDIFRGVPDKNAVWVETVVGLSSARERMEQIARAQPDTYFVFSRADNSIFTLADTSKSTAKLNAPV